MSANIFGERFQGRDKPAWHNIGQVINGNMGTASDVIRSAGLDYQVHKIESVVEIPTPFGVSLTRTGQYALMREPTADDDQWRFFGHVSQSYEVINNLDIAEILDPLTQQWPVETVGALGYGESMFIALKVQGGRVEIKGDEIEEYFLINDNKDGRSGLKVAFTPIRVVCQNTLISGLRQASIGVSLAHLDTARTLRWRVDLLNKLTVSMDSTVDVFRKMAEKVLKSSAIEATFKAAYPGPSKPSKVELMEELNDQYESGSQAVLGSHYEEMEQLSQTWKYYCDMADARRREAKLRLERFNDEFPQTANTAWAVYNAVVENEDWRDGPASMYQSAIFGERARVKRRAMAYLVKSK